MTHECSYNLIFQTAPQCIMPRILRGLFWDSGSGFHNPSSSPLPHLAKSSPFSSFKCPLISLTLTPCMAVIWFVPIFHLHQVHINRLVCQQGASSVSSFITIPHKQTCNLKDAGGLYWSQSSWAEAKNTTEIYFLILNDKRLK